MTAPSAPPTAAPPRRRILVVDDESVTTQLVRMVLEQTGKYEVREVNTSAETFATIHEFMPDLILLDVLMPGLDGADIIYRIRDDPRLKHIPVIFHTATVHKAQIEARGGLISDHPFLPKPASAAQLIACIEKHLPPAGR